MGRGKEEKKGATRVLAFSASMQQPAATPVQTGEVSASEDSLVSLSGDQA